MDGTARIYDVETSHELQQLTHHGAEVIAARFNRDGQMLLTGSFDHTAAICDVRSKRWVRSCITNKDLLKKFPLQSLPSVAWP